MKKTIVVIILAVYIASIAIVNFFGLEVKVFDGITYVESIQCDTVTLRNESSAKLYPITYLGEKGDIPLFEFTFIPNADGTFTRENAKRPVRIADLLTMTAGLDYNLSSPELST